MRLSTIGMLRMLPKWISVPAENNPGNLAGILDAVAGQLDDLDELVENVLSCHATEIDPLNIDGINLRDIDQVYKTIYPEDIIIANPTIIGWNGTIPTAIIRAENTFDFWRMASEAKYFRDPDDGFLYINQFFDRVTLESAELETLHPSPVWGPFDEIGLLIGCSRISGERNPAYSLRLNSVYITPGSSTQTGIKQHLARKLDIAIEGISAEDISVELDLLAGLLDPESDLLKKILAISRDIQLKSGNTFWEVLAEMDTGVDYLPMYWFDARSLGTPLNLVNGVEGDTSLFINGPTLRERVTRFAAVLRLEGVAIKRTPIYPEHTFKYKIFSSGHEYGDGYKPEIYRAKVTATDRVPIDMKIIGQASSEGQNDFLIADQDNSEYNLISGVNLDYWVNDLSLSERENSFISDALETIDLGEIYAEDIQFAEIYFDLNPTGSMQKMPMLEEIHLGVVNQDWNTKSILRIREDGSPASDTAIDWDWGVVPRITVGFDQNTWNDPGPIIKVICDTNDIVNMKVAADPGLKITTTALQLTDGISERIFSTRGDWVDGTLINLKIKDTGAITINQGTPVASVGIIQRYL